MARAPHRPPAAKPYEFVPLPDTVNGAEPTGHHRIDGERLTGSLQIELVAKRPLQVAAGLSDFVQKSPGQESLVLLNTCVYRYQSSGQQSPHKVYVIPGSSVKGVLRGIVEAITPSCVSVVGRPAQQHIGRSRRCDNRSRLCLACRLFGMSSSGARENNHQSQTFYQDFVADTDAVAVLGTPVLWAPARGRSLPPRYLIGNRLAGRKFYYHGNPASGPDERQVLREGTVLKGRIHFINLAGSELGVLLTALGVHPKYPFWLKIGAAKPVGLGSAEARIESIILFDRLDSRGRLGGSNRVYKADSADLKEFLSSVVSSAAELLNSTALQRLQQILSAADFNRSMPSGPY